MTVAELIQKLSTMDPTLRVQMSMNNEYVSNVTEDMVLQTFDAEDGSPIVVIDDCGDYGW